MIGQDAGAAFDAAASRLARLARAIAVARLRSALLARRGDPLRWRSAKLLWPTFTGE